jgi:hypothetical protein
MRKNSPNFANLKRLRNSSVDKSLDFLIIGRKIDRDDAGTTFGGIFPRSVKRPRASANETSPAPMTSVARLRSGLRDIGLDIADRIPTRAASGPHPLVPDLAENRLDGGTLAGSPGEIAIADPAISRMGQVWAPVRFLTPSPSGCHRFRH